MVKMLNLRLSKKGQGRLALDSGLGSASGLPWGSVPGLAGGSARSASQVIGFMSCILRSAELR